MLNNDIKIGEVQENRIWIHNKKLQFGCWVDSSKIADFVKKKTVKKSSSKEMLEIELTYAKNIYRTLENYKSMGLEMISVEIQELVSPEIYKKLSDIFWKYHNANCEPFNRHMKILIDKKEKPKTEKVEINTIYFKTQ